MDGIEAEELIASWDEDLHENQLRLACLDLALRQHDRSPFAETAFESAEHIYRWVSKRTPAMIRIVAVGDVTKQPKKGTPMAQLHDDEQFDITVSATDAKGFQLSGEALTVTSADETVATVQDQGNGVYLIVAGNPGSTIVTFDAGQDDEGNDVSATEAVDVVPGGVATIALTEGTPTPQTPAAPPADGGTPTA